MTVATEAVTIKWNSDLVVTADVDGHWVTWTRYSDSWECNCGDLACHAVLATRQVTGR